METLSDIALLILGALVGGFVSFFFERRKQSLKIRASMIEPVEEWVKQVNLIINIVGDDLIAISQGFPLPMNYNLDERREVSRKLAAETPKVMAILKSRTLHTLGTRGLATRLSQTIEQLNIFIQGALLPADIAVTEKAAVWRNASKEMETTLIYAATAGQYVQEAYILISQLKTRLY
jgi:hypothetical protein